MSLCHLIKLMNDVHTYLCIKLSLSQWIGTRVFILIFLKKTIPLLGTHTLTFKDGNIFDVLGCIYVDDRAPAFGSRQKQETRTGTPSVRTNFRLTSSEILNASFLSLEYPRIQLVFWGKDNLRMTVSNVMTEKNGYTQDEELNKQQASHQQCPQKSPVHAQIQGMGLVQDIPNKASFHFHPTIPKCDAYGCILQLSIVVDTLPCLM